MGLFTCGKGMQENAHRVAECVVLRGLVPGLREGLRQPDGQGGIAMSLRRGAGGFQRTHRGDQRGAARCVAPWTYRGMAAAVLTADFDNVVAAIAPIQGETNARPDRPGSVIQAGEQCAGDVQRTGTAALQNDMRACARRRCPSGRIGGTCHGRWCRAPARTQAHSRASAPNMALTRACQLPQAGEAGAAIASHGKAASLSCVRNAAITSLPSWTSHASW